MFLAEKERLNPSISTPFTVTKEGFTYLGGKIMPTVNKMIAANYHPLYRNSYTAYKYSRWMKLPIFFIGRINILKMPKYLYLFQSISLSPTIFSLSVVK